MIVLALGYFLLPSKSNPDSPNVLLITIDTLRADRLGCYGYHLDTSPNIDKLAQQGVLFSDCTVQWPKTWPSIGSLVTGMYPKTTGLRMEHHMLPESLYLLSEVFKQAGYRTGAVVANFNLGKTFNFQQGFDYFVESWQELWEEREGKIPFQNQAGKVKFFTNASIVNEQCLRYLKKNKKNRKPYFMWLHYMEPHGPYTTPQKYKGYFQNAYKTEFVALNKLPSYQLRKIPGTNRVINDLGYYRGQYDRTIRYFDDELARLLSEIKKLNSKRKIVIIITADHGESLGEHDYYLEHGLLPYQACAHVPLIIVKDGVLPAGKTIDKPVGLIDVSATILDLAGIEIPAAFEGQSLVDLMLDEKNATVRKYTFMESGYHREYPQLTVRDGRWKLIHITSPRDLTIMTGAEYELYDVDSDPGEVHNLADEKHDIVKNLRKVLHDWYVGGPVKTERGTQVDLETLDSKALEMLKSLGYVE